MSDGNSVERNLTQEPLEESPPTSLNNRSVTNRSLPARPPLPPNPPPPYTLPGTYLHEFGAYENHLQAAQYNEWAEYSQQMAEYWQGYAQRIQQPTAFGQVPGQPGSFTGNIPLPASGAPLLPIPFPLPKSGMSNVNSPPGPIPDAAPGRLNDNTLAPSALAGTQQAVSGSRPPLSNPFASTHPDNFSSNLPPVSSFTGTQPPFFTGNIQPANLFARGAAGARLHPFGPLPYPPPIPPQPINMKQAPSAALPPKAEYDISIFLQCYEFLRTHYGSLEVGERKNKHKQPKIYLPAPLPTFEYLARAVLRPEVLVPPNRKLVILDLNGTLLYRPNARKQPKKMISRPFLPQFLAYLFDNFAVMIWSSARPENVKILVEEGLGVYHNRLVAVWARDTLGLAPHHYSANVQVYKQLTRVWASDEIQKHMDGYEWGKRFDQRNTILIDDSALKASAQPHNLLEIPEFEGVEPNVPVQDILGEVVGYLELLKMQEDVSKFIHKEPFRADGTWKVKWADLGVPGAPFEDTDTNTVS
ncbi:hypothetical protein N0V90_011122 [Kalmusia sp. IMI 367209]|nr:hypothetical protein N0V90_011122 [Kalmusia sp. IMI 367209]